MMASHKTQPTLIPICFFQLVLFKVGVKKYSFWRQNPDGDMPSPLQVLLWQSTSRLSTTYLYSQNLADFGI